MKKLLIFLVSLPLVLSGCLKEEKDIFPEDSATRIAKVQKEVSDLLKSAENGWCMEYTPSVLKQYGTYVMFVKFNEGNKVVFASEMADPDQTAESLYTLGSDAGPTLNFDTYNELFHSWSNPVPDGNGLEGDYEFIILEYSKDKVKLRGKKTGNYCLLTPLPTDKTWEAAMTTQIETAAAMDDVPLYAVVFPDAEQPQIMTKSNRTFAITILRGEKAVTSKASFVYTPKGIKFYEPFEVDNGVFIKSMTYNPTTEIFTDDGNSGIKIIKFILPLNELVLTANWYFRYSTMSAWTKGKWNEFKAGLAAPANGNERLYFAYLGEYEGQPGYGFWFASAAGTQAYIGAYTYSAEPVAATDNKITMTCLMKGVANGEYYYDNANLSSALETIAYGKDLPRTFTLTCDNPKSPTWIKFTEDGTAGTANENSFSLYKQQTLWPFDK